MHDHILHFNVIQLVTEHMTGSETLVQQNKELESVGRLD